MHLILNTAFLVVLALAAWLVLCDMKQIENLRPDVFDIDVELKSSLQDKPELRMSCPGEYDVYIKSVCICTCVFAMAKILSMTEAFVTEKMPFGKHLKNILRLAFNSTTSLDLSELVRERERLLLELEELQKYNSLDLSELVQERERLLLELDELKKYNSLDLSELVRERERLLLELDELKKYNSVLLERLRALELSRTLLQQYDPGNLEKFELKATQQNIFIANQHLYVTAKDYANENFSYIWSKYLQKKNIYFPMGEDAFKQKTVQIDNVSLSQQFGNNCEYTPVIVSTEDLQKMRGIY